MVNNVPSEWTQAPKKLRSCENNLPKGAEVERRQALG